MSTRPSKLSASDRSEIDPRETGPCGSCSCDSCPSARGSMSVLVEVEQAWDGESPLEAEERGADMATLVAAALVRAGLGVDDRVVLGKTRCRALFSVRDGDAAIEVIKAALDGSVFADYRGIRVLDLPAG